MDPQLNNEGLNVLTLPERARSKRLPDVLCIVDVVRLHFSDPESQVERDDGVKADTLRRNRLALTMTLIDACSKGLLKYKPGSPPKLFLDHKGPHSRPNATHEVFKMFPGGRYKDMPPCNEWAIIHMSDYKTYLQKSEQWPVDGLIANWWPDDKPKAESNSWFGVYGLDADTRERRNEYVDRWRKETGTCIEQIKPVNRILELLRDHENELFKSAQESDEALFKFITAKTGKKSKGRLWNIIEASFGKEFWFEYAINNGLQR